MENNNDFYFYYEKNGVKWYRCANCGALQRNSPPTICPVCKGIERESDKKASNSSGTCENGSNFDFYR